MQMKWMNEKWSDTMTQKGNELGHKNGNWIKSGKGRKTLSTLLIYGYLQIIPKCGLKKSFKTLGVNSSLKTNTKKKSENSSFLNYLMTHVIHCPLMSRCRK